MISSFFRKGYSIQFPLLLFLSALSFQACKSSGTTQSSASGREYEITDRMQQAREDSLLLERYAAKLDTDYRTIKPWLSLYKFIDKKMDTPCSEQTSPNSTNDVELAQQLFKKVYNRKVPGSYKELYNTNLISRFSSTSELAEGDLLFFEENKEDHQTEEIPTEPLEKLVGIYLRNNHFVTCADEDGAVAINELNRPYWKSRYILSGRLK